jgi:competence protein ComEA
LKKILKAFSTFSRTERIGLLTLACTLLLLITARIILSFWPQASGASGRDNTAIKWDSLKRNSSSKQQDSAGTREKGIIKTTYESKATTSNHKPHGTWEIVDINTTDAATIVKLTGVTTATAEAVIVHRNKIGRYSSNDQIDQISGISRQDVSVLKDHLVVNVLP